MAVRLILVALLVAGGEPSQFLDPEARQSSLRLLLPSLQSDNNELKTQAIDQDTRPSSHSLFRPRIQGTNNDIKKPSPPRGTTPTEGQSSRTSNSIARLRQKLRRPQIVASTRPVQRTRIATMKRPTTRSRPAVTNSGRNRSLLRSPLERSQNLNRTDSTVGRSSSFRRNPARPRFGQRIPIERPKSTRLRGDKVDTGRNIVGDSGNDRRLANIKKKLGQRKPILRRTNQERKKKISQVSSPTTTEASSNNILDFQNANFEAFDKTFGGAIPFTTIVPESTKESITSAKEELLESTTTVIPTSRDETTEPSESVTHVMIQTTQKVATNLDDQEQTTGAEIILKEPFTAKPQEEKIKNVSIKNIKSQTNENKILNFEELSSLVEGNKNSVPFVSRKKGRFSTEAKIKPNLKRRPLKEKRVLRRNRQRLTNSDKGKKDILVINGRRARIQKRRRGKPLKSATTLPPIELTTEKQEKITFETTILPANDLEIIRSTSQASILSTITTMPTQTISPITRLTSETNDIPFSSEQANTIKPSISESTTPLPTTTTIDRTQAATIPEPKSIERSTHMPVSFFEDTISTMAPIAETTHKPIEQAQSQFMKHQSKSLNMQIIDDMTGHDLYEGSGLSSKGDSANFRPDLDDSAIKENTIPTDDEDSARKGREKDSRQLLIPKEDKQHKGDDKIIFINGRRASIKKRRRGKIVPKRSRKDQKPLNKRLLGGTEVNNKDFQKVKEVPKNSFLPRRRIPINGNRLGKVRINVRARQRKRKVNTKSNSSEAPNQSPKIRKRVRVRQRQPLNKKLPEISLQDSHPNEIETTPKSIQENESNLLKDAKKIPMSIFFPEHSTGGITRPTSLSSISPIPLSNVSPTPLSNISPTSFSNITPRPLSNISPTTLPSTSPAPNTSVFLHNSLENNLHLIEEEAPRTHIRINDGNKNSIPKAPPLDNSILQLKHRNFAHFDRKFGGAIPFTNAPNSVVRNPQRRRFGERVRNDQRNTVFRIPQELTFDSLGSLPSNDIIEGTPSINRFQILPLENSRIQAKPQNIHVQPQRVNFNVQAKPQNIPIPQPLGRFGVSSQPGGHPVLSNINLNTGRFSYSFNS